MRLAAAFALTTALIAVTFAGETTANLRADEETLRSAGLNTDGASLLEFFQKRARPRNGDDKLLALARKLADPNAEARAKTAAHLIACGPAAIPALRHVLNDLEEPGAAASAERCLEWLEGNRRTEIPIAAATLLAARKPPGATEALLAYLPLADDGSVIDSVKAALVKLAADGGKPTAALVKALQDPVPMRRAIAVEVLCSGDQPDVPPDVRKLLADPKPQVRMQAALALAERHDEQAIAVLIDLLADLPPGPRRLVEGALQQLAGEWSPNPALPGDDPVSRKIRRDAWAAWWRNTDSPALLAAFHEQTITPADLVKVQMLIEKLGDMVFNVRERATSELVALGPKVVPLLRDATRSPDLERANRAESCLKLIGQQENEHKLPLAAARLLAVRKPAGASAALLEYLPFTDDTLMKDEVVKALKQLARASEKPDSIVIRSLGDALAIRRSAAAEALAAAGGAENLQAIRKLLKDPDPQVRLRVAMALVRARDKEAVQQLIDVVAEAPTSQGWEGEEMLFHLAGENAPQVARGDNPKTQQQFHAAWNMWWQKNAANVDLAKLDSAMEGSGLMLVVEIAVAVRQAAVAPAQAGKKGNPAVAPAKAPAAKAKAVAANAIGTHRVVGLDRAGEPRWEIDDLATPVDACLLPGNRVLIAESAANRVTERDFKGNVLWQVRLPGNPTGAQRLPNGNTFVALSNGVLIEVDRAGKTVFNFNVSLNQVPANNVGGFAGPGGINIGSIRGAYKTANGQIVCLADQGTCLYLNANGKLTKSFRLVQPPRARMDITPNGHLLVVENDNMIREYDLDGKVVWQTNSPAGNTTPTRLPNGHTVVATYNAGTVVELDGAGRVAWEYRAPPGYYPLRVRK